MQLTLDGLIVKAKNIGEFDRLLVLLTADRGLVTAYAKNVRKRMGATAAATELLSYSHFVLFQSRGKTFVDKAEPNRIFFGIRQDVGSLSLATYFCQLRRELVSNDEPAEMSLRLLLNALHLLEAAPDRAALLKAVVELRLLCLGGYMPDLTACAACGEALEQKALFLPREGVAFCSADCLPGGKEAEELPPAVLAAMRHIVYSPLKRLFSFRLADGALNRLGQVCESYLLAQVERVLPALNFYHSVCGPSPA